METGNYFLGRSLWSLFILQSCVLFACSTVIDQNSVADKLALLSFKSALSDPSGALSSWSNQSIPLCSWRGVTCGDGRHAGRVTALELDSLNLTGPIHPSLSNITYLDRLHLAVNKLAGHIPPELGQLSRLSYLNLSHNHLDGRIPVALSNCSSLQNLTLTSNSLVGEIPTDLAQCSDLRVICLDHNMLVGAIPDGFATLRNLSRLYLSSNNFTGSVPSWLGSKPSLARIDLSTNGLTGTIPESLANLSSLIMLDLSENSLVGSIPASLGNCSSLIYLALRRSGLRGSIPESLSQLASLSTLDLSFNQLIGTVPSSIYNLSAIQTLSLGVNSLVGALPADIGTALPLLQYLNVQGNQFDGPIPLSLANASQIELLDLSENRFTGIVPSNLGELPYLFHLNLASNDLHAGNAEEWSFLTSLSNCTSLSYLIISNISLAGDLPRQVGNLSSQLEWLLLGINQISGSIPAEIGNLVGLTRLTLDQNLLMSAIPEAVGKLRTLNVLDLGQNKLSGRIPVSLSNLTGLSRLTLADNNLEGSVPTSFEKFMNLEVLDLSYNQLGGVIPLEVVRISSLSRLLDLSHNSLSGSLPPQVGGLKNLVQLDVSYNNLSGELPGSLGDCQILQYLYMQHNFFDGSIPLEFSNLKGIQELDLSNNNLSGTIPDMFGSIRNLQLLNLSFNELEGQVPMDGIFQNSSAFSILGNNKLCGGDPKLQLPPCSIQAPKDDGRFHALKLIIGAISAVIGLIFLTLFAAFLWKRKSGSVTWSDDYYGFRKVSYAELRKATDDFSHRNLIGRGSFGSVYRGTLVGSNEEVAVKVLNLQQKGALKSFVAECETLRRIRHRNLVKIITACSSIDAQGNDFKALVFEYMPNGSLDEWQHPKTHGTSCLSFAQRLNIAIDVASAIEYLHHHSETSIVHCDLKPSNILIDDDMSAHVGDFGLARFLVGSTDLPTQDATWSVGIKGSIGYLAPEYGMGQRPSTQGDVYSYGILLLEMLTGKRPTDEIFQDGLTIHDFVENVFPERVMEIVDPHLLLFDQDEEGGVAHQSTAKGECFLVSLMARIGLECTKEAPHARMDMRTVATELQAIRAAHSSLEKHWVS